MATSKQIGSVNGYAAINVESGGWGPDQGKTCDPPNQGTLNGSAHFNGVNNPDSGSRNSTRPGPNSPVESYGK